MQMPFFVRARSNGKTFELRVKHGRLPKPLYRNFDLREDAERAGQRAIAALDRGETPSWLERTERRALVTVSQAIVAYRGISAVPPSTQLLLDTLMNDVGTRPLTGVNYEWAEAWIRTMKLEKKLAPGTIRKRKGGLLDVFDWVVRAHPVCLGANPLDQLPHGYSGYDEYTRQALAGQGIDIPGDVERNRRIDLGEESRIVGVLQRRGEASHVLEEQAEAEALSLMFQLALRTAMRLREIYTLQLAQIRLADKTIYLSKSKNGDRRQVPLSSKARAVLERLWPALEKARRGTQLIPLWDGQLEPKALAATTARLSRLFANAFAEAGSDDLHFHDTRHEALCRWVLESSELTSEQLGRAAGMRDARTRQRYLSLRGSELADILDCEKSVSSGAVFDTPAVSAV
jgi:integrase